MTNAPDRKPFRIAYGNMPEVILARPVMGAMPQNGDTHSNGPWSTSDPYGNSNEYTRTDLSDALIAAACEGLVNQAVGMADGADEGAYIEDRMRDAIPTEARAAYDAAIEQARREGREAGLREAADTLTCPDPAGLAHSHISYMNGYTRAKRDLLALISEDTDT